MISLYTNESPWPKLRWQRYPLIALIVRILVYLWGWRCTRDLVYKCAHTRGFAKYAFQGGEETRERGLGSISPDIKAKRSETRLAGITFRRLHSRLETRAQPAGSEAKRKEQKRYPPSTCSLFSLPWLHARSHCLSLWFTFSRHDGDGDVRFNKAPGMSCHVMHSIACEIYVNTAIRPVESDAVAVPLFPSYITHPLTSLT